MSASRWQPAPVLTWTARAPARGMRSASQPRLLVALDHADLADGRASSAMVRSSSEVLPEPGRAHQVDGGRCRARPAGPGCARRGGRCGPAPARRARGSRWLGRGSWWAVRVLVLVRVVVRACAGHAVDAYARRRHRSRRSRTCVLLRDARPTATSELLAADDLDVGAAARAQQDPVRAARCRRRRSRQAIRPGGSSISSAAPSSGGAVAWRGRSRTAARPGTTPGEPADLEPHADDAAARPCARPPGRPRSG